MGITTDSAIENVKSEHGKLLNLSFEKLILTNKRLQKDNDNLILDNSSMKSEVQDYIEKIEVLLLENDKMKDRVNSVSSEGLMYKKKYISLLNSVTNCKNVN